MSKESQSIANEVQEEMELVQNPEGDYYFRLRLIENTSECEYDCICSNL